MSQLHTVNVKLSIKAHSPEEAEAIAQRELVEVLNRWYCRAEQNVLQIGYGFPVGALLLWTMTCDDVKLQNEVAQRIDDLAKETEIVTSPIPA